MNVGWVGLQVVIEWDDSELDLVRVDKVTYDVILHTAIVGDDGGGVLFAVGCYGFRGDFGD